MRNVRKAACAALGICVLFGCSTFRDQSKAMVGGGAVAGQDYINGLMPSAKARAYFAENSSDEMTKSVAISRTGDDANDTGVRFVANGGVVIPPGVSITFENQGYCCDPHLPAPMAGDEYQFVKTSQLIPDELQSIYRKLLTKASNGDEATLRNMQKLVWALRTAGTEAGYANNLTEQERRILNSCSEYEGEFESYCSEKLSESRLWKFLWAKIDSVATINIGGVTYQASDLLDENVGEKKIKEHLGQLITLGESMPVEHNGFNYGEISDGIYTDIKGTGALRFKATVANSTSREFTFYPMDYVAQVGSGVSDESASVVYYATASSTQKQRVTVTVPEHIEIIENGHEDSKEIDNETDRNRLRSRFDSQIEKMRERLIDQLMNMNRNSELEYGAIIYYQDGEIRSTSITSGNRDYEFATWSDGLVRTTERDGKYYRYDSNNNVITSRSYDNKYCGYDSSFFNVMFETSVGSYPAGDVMSQLPASAIPLEIFHSHTDYDHWYGDEPNHDLSDQDKNVAREKSMNISVVDSVGHSNVYKP